MKNKTWLILLGSVFALCAGLSLWLFRPQTADTVQVYCKGALLYTLSLGEDQVIPIETELGRNVITIQNGQVAVTEADCPDGHCKNRGFCSGGSPIVCLPHRLVLEFSQSDIDAIAGQ